VHHTYADGHRLPTTVASVKEHPEASQKERIMLSTVAETTPNGVQDIRTIILEQAISEEVTERTRILGDKKQAASISHVY